eukprot:CAMPEP_0183466188 /NCGR_PEP_ID=MMETSP0370-20130417/148546_1 /TAXON_ID=268820 /ORGANISM="Peridinium aciculiferum, Strain PAER-2" /LENGTH=132 /DNA_ID=CAMNT_0025658449 /DNA_START=66 /DNA_END=459 /DNA_ORIENTATION=+
MTLVFDWCASSGANRGALLAAPPPNLIKALAWRRARTSDTLLLSDCSKVLGEHAHAFLAATQTHEPTVFNLVPDEASLAIQLRTSAKTDEDNLGTSTNVLTPSLADTSARSGGLVGKCRPAKATAATAAAST